MLLATFQPTASTKAKLIAEHGETIQPLWCFSAETFEEFFVGALTGFPTFPETLIIFETDDYQPVDKVEWHNAIQIPAKIDVTKMYTDDETKPVEYLVTSLPEEKYVINLYNLPELNFGETMMSELQTVVYRTGLLTRKHVVSIYDDQPHPVEIDGKSVVVEQDTIPWIAGKAQMNLYGFIGTLVPFYYDQAVTHLRNKPFINTNPTSDWEKAEEAFKIAILRGINPIDYINIIQDLYSKPFTEKEYLEIEHEIREKVKINPIGIYKQLGHKVERNDPCPCGSGLKAKKCHGTT